MAGAEGEGEGDGSGGGALHNGHPYGGSPLGPRAVIVVGTVATEQVGEDEPGVAGLFSHGAVGDDVVFVVGGADSVVDVFEGGAGEEAGVGADCAVPGDVEGGGDVSAAGDGAGEVGGKGVANVLVAASGVDDERGAECGEYVLTVDAEVVVVAFDDGVVGLWVGANSEAGGALFEEPGVAATVEEADVGVAEEGEDPQCVGGPPVGFVAVEDDGVVLADTQAAHQAGEVLSVDEVADVGVEEVFVPVEAERAGDVADVVEEAVSAAFEDTEPWVVEVFSEPFGGDEALWVRVVVEPRVVIVGRGHAVLLGREVAGRKVVFTCDSSFSGDALLNEWNTVTHPLAAGCGVGDGVRGACTGERRYGGCPGWVPAEGRISPLVS